MRQLQFSCVVFSLSALFGCGESADEDGAEQGVNAAPGEGATGEGNASGDSAIDVGDLDAGQDGTDDDAPSRDTPPAVVHESLPEGFSEASLMGGWRVLGSIEDYDEPATNVCANVLRLVIRDFPHSHVDFGSRKPASWLADGLQGWYTGHVLPELDSATGKPVVNPDRVPLDVMERFDEWYVNVPGTNTPYVMDIWLEPDGQNPGFFVFDSDMFFPLDEDPYIDLPDSVFGHNFGFTTELRTAFEYKGGEVFTFRGDDDVFAFINGKLAVDIGGIHNAELASVDLDERASELGLVVGGIYDLVLFQAERNPGASNYRIETSLDFKECGILSSDIVVR